MLKPGAEGNYHVLVHVFRYERRFQLLFSRSETERTESGAHIGTPEIPESEIPKLLSVQSKNSCVLTFDRGTTRAKPAAALPQGLARAA